MGCWVDPRAALDDWRKKFLILSGLELRPLGRPARNQSLSRRPLRCITIRNSREFFSPPLNVNATAPVPKLISTHLLCLSRLILDYLIRLKLWGKEQKLWTSYYIMFSILLLLYSKHFNIHVLLRWQTRFHALINHSLALLGRNWCKSWNISTKRDNFSTHVRVGCSLSRNKK
jgi:hypothetical protein